MTGVTVVAKTINNMEITNIEIAKDKNGNEMKICTFGPNQKVWVNSKYDATIYEQVIVGSKWEVVQEGSFNKIKYDKPAPTTGGRGNGIAKAMERKEQGIAKTMDRKENGMLLSGTSRDATLITLAQFTDRPFTDQEFQEKWRMWRTWLIDNHGDPEDLSETKQPF